MVRSSQSFTAQFSIEASQRRFKGEEKNSAPRTRVIIMVEVGPPTAVPTGLVQMQQRYYDPRAARFWSVDPVTALNSGDSRQFNRYTYAFNNPYRYSDLDGRQSLEVWPVPGYGQLNESDKPREGRGEFGAPRNTSRGPSTHSGIDIKAPAGTPVVAAGDGEVVDIQPNPSTTYGNQVVIDHGEGTYTQSAHLDSTSVEPGDSVEAGQQIGTVGTTGNTPKSGDAHLHFEVRKGGPAPRAAGGTVVDPAKELPTPPPPPSPPSPPPFW